jgi:hypothetical protein
MPGEVKALPPRRPFAALPHDLAADPRITPTDKTLLLALTFWARDKDRCWPADASIARRIGRSEATVQRRLLHLEALGIIRRQKTDNNRTGRIIFLAWREGDPPSPVRGPGPSPVRDEGDVIVKGETLNFRDENLPQRQRFPDPLPTPSSPLVAEAAPAAEAIPTAVPESPVPSAAGPEAAPAPLLPVVVLPAPGSPPAPTPPAPALPAGAIPGAGFGLTPGQQSRLAELPDSTRDRVLTWLALDDPILRREAERLLTVRQESRGPAPRTLPELLERIGESPGYAAMGASWMAEEFGDVKSWHFYQQVLHDGWAGRRTPASLLEAYRQARSPKAKCPGAVFCHALKRQAN